MKNEIVKVATHKEAAREILSRLGHEIQGSIQAGLDAAQIQSEESGADTIYTHPSLPGVEVIVECY